MSVVICLCILVGDWVLVLIEGDLIREMGWLVGLVFIFEVWLEELMSVMIFVIDFCFCRMNDLCCFVIDLLFVLELENLFGFGDVIGFLVFEVVVLFLVVVELVNLEGLGEVIGLVGGGVVVVFLFKLVDDCFFIGCLMVFVILDGVFFLGLWVLFFVI